MLLSTICSVCNELRVVEDPVGSGGYSRPDCDLRNWDGSSYLWPEPVRGCHACGAAGPTLGYFGPESRAVVTSDAYQELVAGLPPRFRDEFAAGYLASAMQEHDTAFVRYLAASWIADAAVEADPQDVAWRGLADRARRAAIDAWIAAAGDIFQLSGNVRRSYDEAEVTLVGDVMLDNLVLIDLLRRVADWERAEIALHVGRAALQSSREEWGEMPLDEDTALVVAACDLAFDLEDAMISHRRSERANAALDLPLWWAE